MTRDEIIHIGVESGLLEPGYPVGERVAGELERFAALVATAEREACAQVCYRHAAFVIDPIDKERIHQCAADIRARSQQ